MITEVVYYDSDPMYVGKIVFPATEAGFGDPPALVFIDTQEETYHEVRVPSAGDWFVTRIWYGP